MSQEQEIKLQVLTSSVLDLSDSALLTQHQMVMPTKHEVSNTYLDTPDRQLVKAGFGLRLRGLDAQWLQTVKTSGQVIGGLHQRQEWEQSLTEASLNREMLVETGLAELIADDAVWTAIEPVFTTHFTRDKWLLEVEETQIELAYDRGEVVSDDKQTPIHEVELELVLGSVDVLKQVAEHLKSRWPLAYSDISKAQMGYALAAG
jgi:inorganic triphosphatase YgiF